MSHMRTSGIGLIRLRSFRKSTPILKMVKSVRRQQSPLLAGLLPEGHLESLFS